MASLFYAGVVVGFSFIATPAKFFTPGLEMSQLLLVGRTSFGVFAWAEAALALGVCLLAFQEGAGRVRAVLVGGLVAAQYLVLRPILDARVSAIVQGASPEPSNLHHVYGVLEAAKLVTLLWLARSGARGERFEGRPPRAA